MLGVWCYLTGCLVTWVLLNNLSDNRAPFSRPTFGQSLIILGYPVFVPIVLGIYWKRHVPN